MVVLAGFVRHVKLVRVLIVWGGLRCRSRRGQGNNRFQGKLSWWGDCNCSLICSTVYDGSFPSLCCRSPEWRPSGHHWGSVSRGSEPRRIIGPHLGSFGSSQWGRVPPPLVASPSILGDEVPILLHLLTCEGGTPFVGLLFDVGGESPHSISGSVGIWGPQ